MRPIRAAFFAGLSTLLLAGCGTSSYPSPYGSAPSNAERDAVQTWRGNPQARVIVREGPVVNSDTALSPEEAARQQAGQYCASVNLDLRVLDVRKERAGLLIRRSLVRAQVEEP